MREILTAGRYFRRKFREKVYKVPISIFGFTCPNIDGKVARGGCSFCENESFSPNLSQKSSRKFYLNPDSGYNPFLQKQIEQVRDQYRYTKIKLEKKFGAKKFIAYFQSFTNTYAPMDTLKALYEEALLQEDCIGLSIGTRTDSVNDEVLQYLAKLSKEKEIWIEYGIQSVYDKTLEAINRGHGVENMKEWIVKSKEYGLNVCGHLIFGLPGEDRGMMLDSVEASVKMKVDSLKIHPMYVTENTALAIDYKRGKFTPITQKEYIETLIEAFDIIPQNIMIQRVTAGIDDASLIAPLWCKNKHTQMKNIREAFLKKGLIY